MSRKVPGSFAVAPKRFHVSLPGLPSPDMQAIFFRRGPGALRGPRGRHAA